MAPGQRYILLLLHEVYHAIALVQLVRPACIVVSSKNLPKIGNSG